MEEFDITIPSGFDGDLPVPGFGAPNLPYNYVPAVLSGPEEPGEARNRVVVILPKAEEVAPEAYRFHVLSEEVLSDPSQVSGALFPLAAALRLEDVGEHVLLGPRTTLGASLWPSTQSDDLQPYSISLAPTPGQDFPAAKRVVVIIDHGIAFWNRRFRGKTGTRFTEIRLLNFDFGKPGGNPPPDGVLDETELAFLTAMADGPAGEAGLIDHLRGRVPASFFGAPEGVYRDGFWHGTAMADIAFGDDDFGPETVIYGIELPRATIEDAKGDVLAAVLPVAVQMAISMTESFRHLPLVVAAAFAFPAARHDGQHPAARSISAVLASAAVRRQVSLVLPAGNNLQDRGVACLEPEPKKLGDRSVTWRIAPDDASPNAVEILLERGGRGPEPLLGLTAPGMAPMPIVMPPGAALPILYLGSKVLGWVVRRSDTAQHARYRIGLLPTGRKLLTTLVAPFGDWTITVESRDPAWLWILRDDTDRFSAKGAIDASEFDDPDYRERDGLGDFILDDRLSGALRRSGSASILTTASGIISVQANERLTGGQERSSTYSARKLDGTAFDRQEVIEDRHGFDGVEAVANGGDRRFRVQGTSAAVAVAVREILRAVI